MMIDLGPGICDYAKSLSGVELSDIEAIVLTHTHEDHWNTDELNKLLSLTNKKVKLYFHVSAKKNLELDKQGIHGNGLFREALKKMILCPMRRWQSVSVGECTFQNLEANHYAPRGERGSHYIISDESSTWFYGCDGGWFTTKTWDVLRTRQFDGVILDGTIGENSGDYRIAGHNSLAMNKLLRGAMEQQNMLIKGTQLYLSHFGMRTYDDEPQNIGRQVEKIGFIEARDGLVIQG